MSAYRDRIYGSYVKSRLDALAPESLEGLTKRRPYLCNLIRLTFPKELNASILDLGCGHGALLYYARMLGYHNIRGVDGAEEQVAAAKQLGIEGIDMMDIHSALRNQNDSSLDAVVTFDVIEHFTRDELISLVDDIFRVLKAGGHWIIHVPNGESPFCGRMRFWDITHELAFTRTSLGQLALSSGFSKLSCYEDAPVCHGIKSMTRLVLWKVLRAIFLFMIAIETGSIDRRAIFSQNLLAVAIK